MVDPLRVLVAHAQQAAANGIAQIIGRLYPQVSISGMAQNGAEMLRMAMQLKPHAVVLDCALPGPGCLALYAALLAAQPQTGIIILCDTASAALLRDALPPQTVLCLLKPLNPCDLTKALAQLAEGLSPQQKTPASENPDEPASIVLRVQAYLKDNYDKQIHLADIAGQYCFSGAYLAQLFLEETGLTPHQYLTQYRIACAKHLLVGTKLSIMEVGARVGFPDPFHFSTVFKQNEHISPAKFRKTGALRQT